jgi:pimeloyl-ACP methyl ester carboxylesterase
LLGYSASPPQGLNEIVETFTATLDSLPEPIRLVGISYGGLVAARLASHRPDLVSHLILIASAPSFSAEGLARVRKQICLASEGRYPELVREFAGVFRRPWFNWLLNLRLTLRRQGLADEMNDPDVICAYLQAGLEANGHEGTTWLERVQARTLVIGGGRDQFFGDGRMEETAAAIPGACLIRLPGETHMAPIERAAAVRRALGEFLSRSGDVPGSGPQSERNEKGVQT